MTPFPLFASALRSIAAAVSMPFLGAASYTVLMHTNPAPAIARLLALGGELTPAAPGAPHRKYDLAHMRALLAALGHPEQRFPAVLIAGTNGKGSTAATLASILVAAGHRTGLYTSPHLERPNERIRINGEAIADNTFAAAFEQVESATATLLAEGALPHAPSFFEAMTAIAFLHFAAAGVAIAVLEVGLGGRLDATNTVEPLLSVITDIALDHTQWLGDTLGAIAREKAGILRQNGTLITLPQHPEVNQSLGEVAVALQVQGINAADYLPGRDTPPLSLDSQNPAQPRQAHTVYAALRNSYVLPLPGERRLTVDSPLAGSHQQRNLALAIAAAHELNSRGFPIPLPAVEQGIRETLWPARLELLQQGTASVLLDAAHNPAGVWALRAALSALPHLGARTLLFGIMSDKAIDEIAQILFPVFDTVLLTRLAGVRSATLDQLARAARQTGTSFLTYEGPSAALHKGLELASGGGLLVVAGSVALTGAIRQELTS